MDVLLVLSDGDQIRTSLKIGFLLELAVDSFHFSG